MNCVKCGKPMKATKGSYTFSTPVGNITIPGVSYFQCECGEVMFSLEETKRIEECCCAFIQSRAQLKF